MNTQNPMPESLKKVKDAYITNKSNVVQITGAIIGLSVGLIIAALIPSVSPEDVASMVSDAAAE